MTEDPIAYQPDENLKRRQDAHRALPKPPLTTDKPISFRVQKTRPPTQRKHYPRKRILRPTVEQYDPRNVHFF